MPDRKSLFPKWEFWPFWLFYFPVYIKVIWLAIKSGNSTFFSLVNPCMKWGGLFSYSKSDILGKVNPMYLPKQIEFESILEIDEVFKRLEESEISFPFIVKPDHGERGKGVQFIQNENQLRENLDWDKQKVLIQEYIDYPLEIGIFFVRNMENGKGFISSLMERKLLSITGDGHSSISQLLLSDDRLFRYNEKLKNTYPELSGLVLEEGETKLLEPIGNHNRGTMFLDARDKYISKLDDLVNSLVGGINDFNYGRLDLKCTSWDDLYEGKNIKILEINGVNSEPAHIYNPGFSLFQAYKDVFRHWDYIYKIAGHNARKGFESASIFELYRDFRDYLKDN